MMLLHNGGGHVHPLRHNPVSSQRCAMEPFNIDADQAFAPLKRLSQSTNTILVEAARKLVAVEGKHGRM